MSEVQQKVAGLKLPQNAVDTNERKVLCYVEVLPQKHNFLIGCDPKFGIESNVNNEYTCILCNTVAQMNKLTEFSVLSKKKNKDSNFWFIIPTILKVNMSLNTAFADILANELQCCLR